MKGGEERRGKEVKRGGERRSTLSLYYGNKFVCCSIEFSYALGGAGRGGGREMSKSLQ